MGIASEVFENTPSTALFNLGTHRFTNLSIMEPPYRSTPPHTPHTDTSQLSKHKETTSDNDA